MLHPDRLLPPDPATRAVARDLLAGVQSLPLVCPHGHTDPRWWGEDPAFPDAAELLVIPDHYVVRMLVSQGVPFEALGIGMGAETDRRAVWRTFASHYPLFRGTPSRMWIDHALSEVFGLRERPSAANADAQFDAIGEMLATPAFRPRALYDRFGIEVIATTDDALSDLRHHEHAQGWHGRVIPTYRPDAVTDPEAEGYAENVERLGDLTGEDATSWRGYLAAHRRRRLWFSDRGATATDHGHPTAATLDLEEAQASALFQRALRGHADASEAEALRAQMLTEFARMSLDDGLVMQLHAGSRRNHSRGVLRRYGRDRGFDIPARTDWVGGLRPLLNAVGMDPRLTLILFTLDESSYARELAPLAGAYPCLRLGPPWWFHDSPEGMRRFREQALETAGFENTAGFNDDTRALPSIPARHDVARRVDCAMLAELVTTHRLDEAEAHAIAPRLAVGLAREAYRL
ncbi:glucuronate isomerase [Jannaschia sp. Os4]|uniref:glucuronate isomerase n=1 Tax=Jannaschia sp. Os4 TaxID=2807617 RepID=UPI0019392D17|nr:glucuronate isomerase [Jannaschia sp. Os4]